MTSPITALDWTHIRGVSTAPDGEGRDYTLELDTSMGVPQIRATLRAPFAPPLTLLGHMLMSANGRPADVFGLLIGGGAFRSVEDAQHACEQHFHADMEIQ